MFCRHFTGLVRIQVLKAYLTLGTSAENVLALVPGNLSVRLQC